MTDRSGYGIFGTARGSWRLPSPDVSCGADIGCPDVFHVSLSDDAPCWRPETAKDSRTCGISTPAREILTVRVDARAGPGSRLAVIPARTCPRSWPSARTGVCSRPARATARFGSGRSRRAQTGVDSWHRRRRTRSFCLAVPPYAPTSVPTGPACSSMPSAPVGVLDVATGETFSLAAQVGFRDAISADGSRVAFIRTVDATTVSRAQSGREWFSPWFRGSRTERGLVAGRGHDSLRWSRWNTGYGSRRSVQPGWHTNRDLQ